MNPNNNCICCQSDKAEKVRINIDGMPTIYPMCNKHIKQFAKGEISESDMIYCINNRNAGKYVKFLN